MTTHSAFVLQESGKTRLRTHSKRTTFARFVAVAGVFVFLLLFSAAAFAQAPAIPGVTTLRLKSEVLGEERIILVRTPSGYEAGNQRYPVLYMTDGDAHIGHTGATIEFLSRNGRMSELIVVGITNTDRTRDLSPTHVKTAAVAGVQFPTSGGADKFLKFIESELIPDIEKRYRVQPYRILAGHSLGGLFVVHAMLSRPELFNSYIRCEPGIAMGQSSNSEARGGLFQDAQRAGPDPLCVSRPRTRTY